MNALTFDVENTEQMLAFGFALIGRFAGPECRFLKTLGNTPTLIMECSKQKLCLGVSLYLRPSKRLGRALEIFRDAFALKHHNTENK